MIWRRIAAAGGLLLAGFAVYRAVWAALYPLGTDFGDGYVQGRTIWDYGLAAAYDPARLEAVRALIRPQMWYRYEFTPAQALLNSALASLPLPVASWLWTGVLVASLIAIWLLIGRRRWWALVGLFALLLAIEGLRYQAPDALVMLGFAAAVRLAEEEHAGWAGVALLPALLKPQMLFLLPVALIAARYWRTFAVWALSSLAVSAILVWAIGIHSLEQWLSNLVDGSVHQQAYLAGNLTADLGMPRPATFGLIALAAIATAIAAARTRQVPTVYAAGALASLGAAPFLHGPQLALAVI